MGADTSPLRPETIDQLQQAVAAAQRVLLSGPVDPDGDSIGACLGLAQMIRACSSARVEVAGSAAYRYAWLDGASDMVPDAAILPDYDVVIIMDGDRRRLVPTVERAFLAAPRTVLVDHHASTEPEGYDIVLLDPSAASTTAMVDGIRERWGLPLDPRLAAALYTGLIFDTGGFRHSNTRPSTLALAARLIETGIDHATISVRVLVERRPAGLRLLGAVLERVRFTAEGRVCLGAVQESDFVCHGADGTDLEGIVDALVYTRGVEVACLLVERGPARVKLSLRSRTDTIDVSRVARSFHGGGGGHPRAAGVVLEVPLEEALRLVTQALDLAVARVSAA